jgi:hypothetical protein
LRDGEDTQIARAHEPRLRMADATFLLQAFAA